MNFSSLKRLVEDWLDEQGLHFSASVSGLGPGCRGVHIYLFNTTAKEFIDKYGMIDNKYLSGWFSPCQHTEHKIYVSCKKK